MANSPSVVDFSIPLADFLATAVSDGTYSDIIETEKQDKAGAEASATEIKDFYGQLLGNLRDDFFLAVYTQLQGSQVTTLSTVGAVTDSLTVATLPSNGDAYYIEVTVVAKTSGSAELVQASLSGTYYRSGGTVFPLGPIHTVNQIGLAGADADLVISANDVDVVVTGVAAKSIGWDVIVKSVRELSGP